ncbi:MAG: rhamnulokinase family protein [Eubacteriales bacterium]|nr:rhamnulokinase family protein [Eubacteriales bacterium]
MKNKYYLAIDLGATSGRGILGSVENGKLTTKEIHRFQDPSCEILGTRYWDAIYIFGQIKECLRRCRDYPLESVSIDSWGVDFALLDRYGNLLQNPVHYRDNRTDGVMEKVFNKVPAKEVYQKTGIERIYFNTLYQLYSLKIKQPKLLEVASKLLFMPDLFNYFLTGKMATEYTIASTSQMLNAVTGEWDRDLLNRLDIDADILPEMHNTGSYLQEILPEIKAELGLKTSVKVVLGCSHDTQSALATVCSKEKDFLFLSSGTWSLFGTRADKAHIDESSEKYNFTNERALGNTFSFHKNIMGMWLLEECKRIWGIEDKKELKYEQIMQSTTTCERFKYIFDVDNPTLVAPDNMPEAIKALCLNTYGSAPKTRGEIVLSILESLALKYRLTKEQVENITGKRYNVLHIVGGGSNNALLNRLTADCLNIKVVAGPAEATAIGNILVQAGASYENSANGIALHGEDIKIYLPENPEAWEEVYKKYKTITA